MNEKDYFRSDETICCEIKCRKRASSWWRPLVQFLAVFVCLNMKWHCIVFFCLGGEGMPAVNPTRLILSGSLATNAWAFRLRCFHTVANKNKQETHFLINNLIDPGRKHYPSSWKWMEGRNSQTSACIKTRGRQLDALCLLFLPLNATSCLETSRLYLWSNLGGVWFLTWLFSSAQKQTLLNVLTY